MTVPLKLFEYFRNLSTPDGFEFLQETHSSVARCRKKMEKQFSRTTVFSHGKTNSCGVTIDYYGKSLSNLFIDKLGRVLIIEVGIENEVSLLINLCDANTENEQLSTLSDLSNMLEKVDDINNKNIVFREDFYLFLEGKLEAQRGNPILKKNKL